MSDYRTETQAQGSLLRINCINMDYKGKKMLRSLKASALILSITTLSACMSTGSKIEGPIAQIDNQKWQDSGAWASGAATWAYDVLEVFDSASMQRVYKKTFIDFSTRIELPPGEYLVISKCYFNTRNANNPERHAKRNEHTVTIEANKTLTFDFAETTARECKLSPRMFGV